MASTALRWIDDAHSEASTLGSVPVLAVAIPRLPAPEAASPLVGREKELHVLDALLAKAALHGGALLLQGDPGVGKSVLLAAAIERAEGQGMQVWRASGVRSEAGVPFAGLHQILNPLLERAHGQRRPHREALLASFGTDNSARRDTFLIAVATLELLAEVASKQPLLIAIDDGHWLDAKTAEVLGFVARRLAPVPLALLLAARAGYDTALAGFKLPELRIEALDEAAANTLLDRHAPRLNPRLHARVLAEAAGNPLALVELAAAPRSDPAAFGRPERLPTTARLDRTFVEQVLHLPVATRAALLTASVDERASLDEILAATALMGDDSSASIDYLAPAVDAGLVGYELTRAQLSPPAPASGDLPNRASRPTPPRTQRWRPSSSMIGTGEPGTEQLRSPAQTRA